MKGKILKSTKWFWIWYTHFKSLS